MKTHCWKYQGLQKIPLNSDVILNSLWCLAYPEPVRWGKASLENSCRHYWADLFYRNVEDQGKESKIEVCLPCRELKSPVCLLNLLVIKISNNFKPKSPNQSQRIWMMTEESSAAVSMWKWPVNASGWQTALSLGISGCKSGSSGSPEPQTCPSSRPSRTSDLVWPCLAGRVLGWCCQSTAAWGGSAGSAPNSQILCGRDQNRVTLVVN